MKRFHKIFDAAMVVVQLRSYEKEKETLRTYLHYIHLDGSFIRRCPFAEQSIKSRKVYGLQLNVY